MTATTVARLRPVSIAAGVLGLVPVALALVAPASSRLAVIAVALAIVAALHGFGRVVASWAGDDDAPLGLAVVWGLAVYLGLAGILIAAHALGPASRLGVVTAGGVLGARWLLLRGGAVVDAVRARATVPTVLIGAAVTAILVFMVLAAAGNGFGPFLDAETGYLGQLRRLDDTGGLADPVGFPRAAGLGGQIALAALAGPLDLRAAHLVDRGVLFAVVILLGATLVGRRRGAVALTALVLPLALLAVPGSPDDMAPHWSVVVIVLGAVLALDRARERATAGSALAVVLVAAAAVTLRHALAPFAIVVAIAALQGRRALWRPAAAIGAVVILPFVAALVRARLGAASAPAFAAEVGGSAAARIAICAASGGVAAVILALALPRTTGAIRTLALAACASLACAGALSPTTTAAWQIGVALVLAIVVLVGVAVVGEPADDPAGDPVTRRPPFATAVLFASLVVGGLPMARFVAGRPMLGYQARVGKMLDDARAIGDIPRAETTRLAADYDALQRTIPAGARVGIWVDRADLVRHDTHAIVDLRTPTARTCLAATRAPHACDRLAADAAGLGLRYLLVADPALPPTDPLAALARLVPAGRVIVERGGLALIDLGRL